MEGEYSLEIRTVPIPRGGFNPQNITAGDQNRERAQGQINITQNQISDSLFWGISIVDGFRDLPEYRGDNRDPGNTDDPVEDATEEFFRSQPHTQFTAGDYVPHGGTGRLLPNVNEERIVPGITISNNIISNNWEGGLQLNGDPNGIVLRAYDIEALVNIEDNVSTGSQNNSQFTLWDHNGDSQTFEFTTDDTPSDPTFIPVRFDDDPMNDSAGTFTSSWAPVNPPTIPFMVANELEHRIRQSDLDIKVYRGEDNSLFLEGAAEIGIADVCISTVCESAFFPRNDDGGLASFPLISADKVQQGAVLYSRVINNTFVGRGGTLPGVTDPSGGIGDVGIEVSDYTSPTLLNNIVANFSTGISSDETSTDDNIDVRTFIGSDFIISQEALGITQILDEVFNEDDFIPLGFQGLIGTGVNALNDLREDFTPFVGNNPTVLGGTLFQGNRSDTFEIGRGDFSIVLGIDDPLFVDVANRNYFLAENARAIDSSVSSLAERTSINETLSSVGLESFGIEAPEFDVLGILRVDDPRVEPPGGLGNNVFVDRGALERADFVGPSASITAPADNDAQGIDQDPAINSIAVGNVPLSEFVVTLSDSGTAGFGSGIDDSSVLFSAITLLRDDVAQVQGVDYILSYNPTNDTLRFLPAAGIWPRNSVYQINIDNSVVMDLAGNSLQANSTDGSTQFLIQTGAALDYGDAPAPYLTTRAENGARHAASNLFLGAAVDLESNARVLSGDSFDDGVSFGSILIRGNVISTSVVASQAGGALNAWVDFNADGDWDDAGEQVFIDRNLVAGENNLSIAVPPNATSGSTWARFRFSSQTGLASTGEALDGEVEDYQVTVASNPWTNPNNDLDVNADTNVSPLDALIVINELNDPQIRDVETGALPLEGVTPNGMDPNFYFDANGDGFVSPIDALLIINRLNDSTSNLLVSADMGMGSIDPVQMAPIRFETDSELSAAAQPSRLDAYWADEGTDHQTSSQRADEDDEQDEELFDELAVDSLFAIGAPLDEAN